MIFFKNYWNDSNFIVRVSFMLRIISIFILAFFFLPFLAIAAGEGERNSGFPNPSGLTIPRFVSLKSDNVNVRTGPGTRYPISFVYRRAKMPVEVIEEFDIWRKIRDVEGSIGWVHKTMLEGKRNVIIKGKKAQIMRIDHEANAKPLLKVEPMVVARLVECVRDWCRVQVDGGRKGWIEKTALWGAYPQEIIE
jgi:SH3-like domain-containing protein